jgi:hypothetical protein
MLGFGKPASIAAGVLFGGAAIKGFYDQVAPKTIDNAMDIAFGDPQADRAVLGTDLTPSMAYMASGLPGTGIARAMNMDKVGVNTGGKLAAATTMGGTAVGAIGGVYAGAKFGGVKGAIAGGVAGLIGGGAAGAGIGFGSAIQTARNNRQIMTESPFYNQSLLTAERLNASGNIVLGMHNGRRG